MNHSDHPNPSTNSPCRYLKAKNSFGMIESGDSQWFGIDDANTQFWCTRSAGAVGPDNGIVGAKECVEGRKCFKNK